MSDRTCSICGTPLAASWSMRGGHQPSGSKCKVAKTARDMAAIDYCYVNGEAAIKLTDYGVGIKYGFIESRAPFVLNGAPATKTAAVTAAFAPKHAAYLLNAGGLKIGKALKRAKDDEEFRAVVITVYELAGDADDARRQALRAYLASEGLL